MREREGVVVRDGLQLERVLLRVVRREGLVEDDERAVAVTRRENEALTVGRPACGSGQRRQIAEGESGRRTKTCP